MKHWLLPAVALAGIHLAAAEWSLNSILPGDVKQGWGVPGIGRSVSGRPLRVNGVEFAGGVGTHADGEIRVYLDGNASRITGSVGIDDGAGKPGTVHFLLIDGENNKTLWDSGLRRFKAPAKPFDIPLDGVKLLLLKCHGGKDGRHNDHADWLDVKIEYAGQPPVTTDPLTVATARARWNFSGVKGSPLIQTGISLQSAAPSGNEPAIRSYPPRTGDATVPASLRVIQSDGSHNLELLLTGFSKQEDGDIVRNVYSLSDPAYPVDVRLFVTGYVATDVFTSRISVKNRGDRPIELLARDAAFVALPRGKVIATTFSGGWKNEFGNCHEFELQPGTLSYQNTAIAAVARPNPAAVMMTFGSSAQEESGTVFAAQVGWSGSHHYYMHRSGDRNYFGGGAFPEPVKLAPGAVYDSPEVVMTITGSGKGQASRNLHRWARRYGIMNGDKERPVILNSWEGVYFAFDEARLIAMMDGAAELGAEMFVLDDGWFGNKYPRNNAGGGLGDWQCNTAKLPGGLDKLIAEAARRNLAFGIWVEPEMVNPASELFERHPDWIMAVPNRKQIQSRNQYLLDLSRPEVEAFVYDSVANLLTRYPGIRYIKWDHNASGVNPGAAHLGDNQGALSDLHNAAYYRVLAKLRKNFPNVMFQLCAGGGGRVDYGSMRYHEEFWSSDQTAGIPRIPIQWGYSHFYPANAMAAHIGKHGKGDFKLWADVAMTGRLGVELAPGAISAADRETVKRAIAAYKTLRPVLHTADLYRGRSPHKSKTTELTFVAPDKSRAVFFGFKLHDKEEKSFLKLSGLDPAIRYRITEMNPDQSPRFQPAVRTGEEWMKQGLEVTFPAKPAGVVAELHRE